MITLQYLEDTPGLTDRPVAAVVEKLRRAADLLPFSHLLIGWRLPRRLLHACREEAGRLGLRLLRWHPLLSGDGVFQPRYEWRVVGATGQRVPGFRGLPEFTFTCPNHPEVREAILLRLEELAAEGIYQGFFLDRLRFPSPSGDPPGQLGCFCPHCQSKAAASGLDLEAVRRAVLDLASSPAGRLVLVSGLLGGTPEEAGTEPVALLHAFLDFRQQSVADFVTTVSVPIRQRGLELGLDCFSPGLARMVGQSLDSFRDCADWVKVMSYAHALGPSGIPYELLGLLDYLGKDSQVDESNLLRAMGQALKLELPASRRSLQADGISSNALQQDLHRGGKAVSIPVLAGFELVEIPGVAELNDARIRADLAAVKGSGAAGLALSWDLWDMPLERLLIVREVFLES